jgi:hypothetical protein
MRKAITPGFRCSVLDIILLSISILLSRYLQHKNYLRCEVPLSLARITYNVKMKKSILLKVLSNEKDRAEIRLFR